MSEVKCTYCGRLFPSIDHFLGHQLDPFMIECNPHHEEIKKRLEEKEYVLKDLINYFAFLHIPGVIDPSTVSEEEIRNKFDSLNKGISAIYAIKEEIKSERSSS